MTWFGVVDDANGRRVLGGGFGHEAEARAEFVACGWPDVALWWVEGSPSFDEAATLIGCARPLGQETRRTATDHQTAIR